MWPNPQGILDLATFIEEIFNGKVRFLCSESVKNVLYGPKCS